MHLPPHLLHPGTLRRTQDVHRMDETTCGSQSHMWKLPGPTEGKAGRRGEGRRGRGADGPHM